METRPSVFRGALLLTAANLALRTVSMGFQVYVSGRVGAAGIGLMQLIMTVGMVAATVGSSGVRVAATYLTAEEAGAGRPGGMSRAILCCMVYGLAVSLLAAAGLYALSDFLAARLLLDARAAAPLRVFAVFLPAGCLASILGGYFTARSKIGRLVAVDFGERLTSIALTAVFLRKAGSDTQAACCAILGGSGAASCGSLALLLILFFWDCRRLEKPPAGLRLPSRLLRLCLPLAVNDYLRTGLGAVEHLLIPRGLARSGESYEASMAAYGTIHGMVFPILMFPACVLYAVCELLVPELARSKSAGWEERTAGLVSHCLRMALLFSACVAGAELLLSRQLGQLFYGSADAGRYLRAFAPLIVMLYMDAVVDAMNKGLGQQVQCVRYNTLTSLLDILLLALLLPRCGIGGYFAGFVLSHGVNFCLSLGRLLKVSGYRPAWRFAAKTAAGTGAALAAAGLFSAALTALPLAVQAAALAALFLGLFACLGYLLQLLSPQDLRWLKRVTRRSVPL